MTNLIQHEPSALKYYRERSGLSVSSLAKKTNISLDKLEKAETNIGSIFTLSQLEKISTVLFTPAVYFTIDERYQRDIPKLIDHRNQSDISSDSYEYHLTINDAFKAREDYLHVLESLNDEVPLFDLELTGIDEIKDAELIRAYLGLDTIKPTEQGSDYYKSWRGLLESKGVMVLEYPKLKFGSDGLAMYYSKMPIIVILSSDQSPSRRLFTLIHELVHLGLKQSVFDGNDLENTEAEERYCNKVAGNVLAPIELVNRFWNDKKTTLEILTEIRKKTKASKAAIAIQLFYANKIDIKELNELLSSFKTKVKEDKSFFGQKKQDSVLNEFGKLYVQNVLRAWWSDAISKSAAIDFLGIKTKPEVLNILPEKVFS
jgi:Zn-dependent peptidase ImmA (M78 family)